jgi:EAL domain-containing protein (putative c-di-GMP-specific phosphodiesterase class I)
VGEITDDLDGAPIVAALIGLGKSLMLRVVAEGVETPAQLAYRELTAALKGRAFCSVAP